MTYKRFISSLMLAAALWAGAANHAYAINLIEHPKVKVVADKLIADGHYQRSELNRIFARATFQQSVLDAMTSPAEYKFTWGKYRKLFLKPDRIQQGVEFWQQYQADLERAESEYGVPASVIVAIIGVESKFGRYKGKHKVLDSLVTLVSGFPRRSKFFASELEEFLILTKENNLDATQILGSYAGAVGFPQFISSSYRNYAIDFNRDGRTDLIDQVPDAIGSIANYFIENGWKPGQPVTSKPKRTINADLQALVNRKRKVQYTAAELRSKGADLAERISNSEKLGVLMLDASEEVHDDKSGNTYIVRAGDTACQIAERFNVKCQALFKLNKLDSRGRIFRGQRLKLPLRASQAKLVNKKLTNNELTKNQDSKWQVASAQTLPEPNNGPQPLYFFTHHNFYAITKYNHSVLYAMAVHDLSQAIDTEYRNTTTSVQRNP